MIDPKTVLVTIPSYDGKTVTGLTGALAACAAEHLFGNMLFLNGCAGPQLARNLLAHGFLRSQYEWMVGIDADIAFTAADFKILMDYPMSPLSMNAPTIPPLNKAMDDEATRDAAGNILLSVAEYSRKVDALDPCRFGLGFVKIHRSVFTALDALNFEDGSPRVQQFLWKGALVSDYFIGGAMAGQWKGEDTGFFELVRLAGITPRIEQRCRLIHVGSKEYAYTPNTGGAQ